MPARKLEWKKIKSDGGESTPLLITPLIDIMFLLLIFFVMNTSFSKLVPLDINLPDSVAPSENIPEDLTLTLMKENRIQFRDRELALSELYDVLAPAVDRDGSDSIIIAGDESISYAFLVKVMDEIGRSGVNDITLLTENQ